MLKLLHIFVALALATEEVEDPNTIHSPILSKDEMNQKIAEIDLKI